MAREPVSAPLNVDLRDFLLAIGAMVDFQLEALADHEIHGEPMHGVREIEEIEELFGVDMARRLSGG